MRFLPLLRYQSRRKLVWLSIQYHESKTIPTHENPLVISIIWNWSRRIRKRSSTKNAVSPHSGYKVDTLTKWELAIHAGFIRWRGTDPYANTRWSWRYSWIPISSSWWRRVNLLYNQNLHWLTESVSPNATFQDEKATFLQNSQIWAVSPWDNQNL